jgi:hypothetical protein
LGLGVVRDVYEREKWLLYFRELALAALTSNFNTPHPWF